MHEDKLFLIVDDNAIDRMISGKLLKKLANEPLLHEIESGQEAIDWLIKNAPNSQKTIVILLDMRMPDMDGFEFMEAYALLDSSIQSNCKIIMLSSMDEASQQTKKALQTPLVNAVLGKPLDVDSLTEII